jgi:hypothetical protein
LTIFCSWINKLLFTSKIYFNFFSIGVKHFTFIIYVVNIITQYTGDQFMIVEKYIPRKRPPFSIANLSKELADAINNKAENEAYIKVVSYANKRENRHTQWELHCAFQMLVKDNERWKDTINTSISELDYDICDDACSHFTGGALEIMDKTAEGKCVVVSDGYYHNIGA